MELYSNKTRLGLLKGSLTNPLLKLPAFVMYGVENYDRNMLPCSTSKADV